MSDQPRSRERRAVPWRLFAEILVGILAVIFVVQNSDSTTVAFLFVEARVHLWLVILISMALGAVLALGLNARRHGRRSPGGKGQH